MKDNASPLTLDSFLNQGIKSLNLSGFTNIEKANEVDVQKAEEPIEKGAVSSALGYGSDRVLVKKTGKEIKDNLVPIKTKMLELITSKKSKMTEILEKLGIQPLSSIGSYELNDLPAEYKAIKRFDWGMCQFEDKSRSYMHSNEVTPNPTASSKDEAALCREYNNCVDILMDTARDYLKADVLSRNLEDKTSYQLSVDQLTALGF